MVRYIIASRMAVNFIVVGQGGGDDSRATSVLPFHAVEAFISSLTNHVEGQVVLIFMLSS